MKMKEVEGERERKGGVRSEYGFLDGKNLKESHFIVRCVISGTRMQSCHTKIAADLQS